MVLVTTACWFENSTRQMLHKLDKQSVYLIFRGTQSKEGLIVKDFNIKDSKATHVGILLYQIPGWHVAHVMQTHSKNDFLFQPAEDFLAAENKIKYVSLWKIAGFGKNEIAKLEKVFDSLKTEKIGFDLTFTGRLDSKKYCSEFVCEALQAAKEGCFHFPKYVKRLSPAESIFLKRDSLYYYPVDIFQTDRRFTKIYSELR